MFFYLLSQCCVILYFFSLIPEFECTKYKSKLLSVKPCDIPDDKLDKENTVIFHIWPRKVNRQTILLSANVTIDHKMGPLFTTFRAYEVNKARDLVYKVEKISCHSPMSVRLIKIIELHIDKDCYMPAGHFKYENLNIDQFIWLFTKSITSPGVYSYDFEFVSVKGIVACFTVLCDMIEVK